MNATRKTPLSRYFSILLSSDDVARFHKTSAFTAMFPTRSHTFMLDDAGIVTGADLRRGGFYASGQVEMDETRMQRACDGLKAHLGLSSAKLISGVCAR